MRVLLAIALTGCAPSPDDTDAPPIDDPPADPVRHEAGDGRTGGDATFVLEVPVQEGETGLMVTVQAEDDVTLRFREVRSPSGVLVLDGAAELGAARQRTSAHIPQVVTSFAWPRLAADGPLEPGTWTLVVETAILHTRFDGYYEFTYTIEPDPDRPFTWDVLVDADPDLGAGVLPIAVVLAGETADDAGIAAALDPALEEAAAIFGSIGIELEVTRHTWPDADFDLPLLDRSGAYRDIAETLPDRAIPVVVVPARDPFHYAAGASPYLGPLVPAATSGLVVVPRSPGVGPTEGEFTADEARAVGRVMTHELGHYAGFFHTVETFGDFSYFYDALDDTPECEGTDECLEVAAANVMFPIACGPDCQYEFSSSQREILQRWVAVR